MRVLMWLDEGSSTIPGGHLTQLRNTAAALEKLGVIVHVRSGSNQDPSAYDVVHGFTMDRRHIRRCREARVPVAISTVYWGRWPGGGSGLRSPRAVSMVKNRTRMAGLLAVRGLQNRHVDASVKLLSATMEQALQFESADLLLPNSDSELHAIRDDLVVSTPAAIVPNGVDTDLFHPPSDEIRRDGVVCAARIEPHKNQLALIRALRGTGIPLTIVGPQHPHHPRYYRACLRAAGKNVVVLPQASPDELAELFGRSRVHVLPSWSETTGLVSLEAAATGCNIVTTDRGYARDYFAEQAWYCSPGSVRSIQRAVTAAYSASLGNDLRDRVSREFTWARAAEETLAAYERLLELSSR